MQIILGGYCGRARRRTSSCVAFKAIVDSVLRTVQGSFKVASPAASTDRLQEALHEGLRSVSEVGDRQFGRRGWRR